MKNVKDDMMLFTDAVAAIYDAGLNRDGDLGDVVYKIHNVYADSSIMVTVYAVDDIETPLLSFGVGRTGRLTVWTAARFNERLAKVVARVREAKGLDSAPAPSA